MFYGLASGEVESRSLEIELVSAPLASLNDAASRGELDATMISAAVYPYLRDRYVLARCGACFAGADGPVLAAREPLNAETLAHARVAVPDSTSSATLALQLSRPGMRTRLLPADKVAQAARMGLADCALLSHSGGCTCRDAGLTCVEDLAEDWARETGKGPLPITCLAIRADLAAGVRAELKAVLLASIRYGLDHRVEAARFARGLRTNGAAPGDDEAPGMYVSERTVDMGTPGREAIEELLRRAHAASMVPEALPLRFAGDPQ